MEKQLENHEKGSQHTLPDVATSSDFRDKSERDSVETDWDTDPENALNWPLRRKWTAVIIVSLYTFVAPLASSMMAPGLQEVAKKYHITDSTTLALTLSIYLLSFAIGPLILAPLSEMYGRTWVLHIGNLFAICLSLGCAFAPTTSSLIGFRFLAGLAGSAPVAIGGGSISDLFAPRDRASAMAIYCLGPLIGPIVGPIAGGFIAQTIGIQWVFITIAITCACSSAIGLPLLRETYAPVILLRRSSTAEDIEQLMKTHPELLETQHGKLHFLWINLSRPLHLLFGSLVCFVLSLYAAFLYGIFYMMFATFPRFFAVTYGFRPGVGGLAYLGIGTGFFIATVIGAKFADQVYKCLARKNDGYATPEMRIPALFFGSLFVPVGLLWYGWSAAAALHWMMPIVGSAFFGFGTMSCFLPIQLYLVDSFAYAASATAAASLFRSLLAFVFPLFGQGMFDKLGLGPGCSLLAGLAIVLGIPFPVWLYYKGEQMRARNPLTRASTLRPKKRVVEPAC